MTIYQDASDITSFKWASVTNNNPLAIKLDGDTTALALIPDSLIDPQSLSIGDRVRVELSLRKCVIHGQSGGDTKPGEGKIWFGLTTTIPSGWMVCQGQSLLRSDYPRLFATLGTYYGAADSTHFNIPDLRKRVPVGMSPGVGEYDTLGLLRGEERVTLGVGEMPFHRHGFAGHVWAFGGGAGSIHVNEDVVAGPSSSNQLFAYQGADGWVNTYYEGGGGSHNNMQPYMIVNYIIKF